jgi:hypothetical protein
LEQLGVAATSAAFAFVPWSSFSVALQYRDS